MLDWLVLEIDREVDFRWIAAAPSMPGVLAYGDSREMAERKAIDMARGTMLRRAHKAREVPL